jgi:hypothetical protein
MYGGGQFVPSRVGDPHSLDPQSLDPQSADPQSTDPHPREWRPEAPAPAKPHPRHARRKSHRPFGWLRLGQHRAHD